MDKILASLHWTEIEKQHEAAVASKDPKAYLLYQNLQMRFVLQQDIAARRRVEILRMRSHAHNYRLRMARVAPRRTCTRARQSHRIVTVRAAAKPASTSDPEPSGGDGRSSVTVIDYRLGAIGGAA
ncbi:MAG: hypothetical protein WKG01_07675 [Kofleriaceae bacterium]